jgi:hypothetical protein
MKLLVDSGLVLSHREGCTAIYTLNRELWPCVEQMLATVSAHPKKQQEESNE